MEPLRAVLVHRPLRLLGALVVVVVAIALLSTTCARPERRSLPPPSSTSSTAPGEATPSSVDRSQIFLQPVRGETTTTLVETGRAVVRGVVVGPDGSVPGAVVRIERLVGEAVQVRDVRTGADGTFRIEGLPGGRLRVRAFQPPALTMTEPEIFFLGGDEERDLRLNVTRHSGLDVRGSTAPGEPRVGDLVNLLVWVGERVVDDDGVGRTVPRAGVPVEIRSSGWVYVDGRPVTDGEGVALFTFRCDRDTSVSAAAIVGPAPDQRTYPLDVPVCASRPVTTTTTTTTAPGLTTTTDPDRTTTTDEG